MLAVAVALNGVVIGPSMVGSPTLSGAERIFGHFVTMTCFRVLGAVSAAGRLFGEGDSDQPGASPVVVLSH